MEQRLRAVSNVYVICIDEVVHSKLSRQVEGTVVASNTLHLQWRWRVIVSCLISIAGTVNACNP